MSDDVKDVTTDETEATEAAATADDPGAEADAAVEEPVAEAVEEPVAEETSEPVAEAEAAPAVEDAPADAPVAEEAPVDEPVAEEAPADDPGAEADEPPVAVEDVPAEEPVAEEAPETVSEAFGPVRVARVYVCERGHRTTTLWGEPDTCQARPTRKGPECGLKLYHITELPEQVQKALNPLKASKKASKKK